GLRAERVRLAHEDYEHSLGNLLGGVRISRLPQRDRIDEVNMPGREGGERWLGPALGEFAQQLDVVRFRHSSSNVCRTEKGTDKVMRRSVQRSSHGIFFAGRPIPTPSRGIPLFVPGEQ